MGEDVSVRLVVPAQPAPAQPAPAQPAPAPPGEAPSASPATSSPPQPGAPASPATPASPGTEAPVDVPQPGPTPTTSTAVPVAGPSLPLGPLSPYLPRTGVEVFAVLLLALTLLVLGAALVRASRLRSS